MLAQQSADGFRHWGAGVKGIKAGNEVMVASEGLLSAQALFAQTNADHALLSWMLRFVALVPAWYGLMMITNPPFFLPSIAHAIGHMRGYVLGIAMFGVALAYCLVVGSIAWLTVRPLASISKLALAAIAAGVYYHYRTKAKLVSNSSPPPAHLL